MSIPRITRLNRFVFTYYQGADPGVAGRHALALLRSQEEILEFSLLFNIFVCLMKDFEEKIEMDDAGQPLTPEGIAGIAHISQCLADNPRAFLGHLDHVTACAES